MKKLISSVIVTSMTFLAPPLLTTAFADEAQKQDRPTAHEVSKNSKHSMRMDQLQEQMNKMQVEMGQIHKATDPTERQKLMQQHTQSMREGMTMMGEMKKPVGLGKGKMGEDDMAKILDLTEQRMKMMQKMMDQMMQHMEMMEIMQGK